MCEQLYSDREAKGVKPSVVILGRAGSAYTNWVITEAFKANLPVTAILLQQWGFKQKRRRLLYYVRTRGLLTTISTVIIQLLDYLILAQHDKSEIPEIPHDKCPVYEVPTLNGKTTQQYLDRLQPSILLLAGVGIIKQVIISKAGKAVINAHPGLVPQYRGNFVVRWALLNGDDVGVTVHLVDTGIDTGPILSQSVVTPPQSRSLLTIETFIEYLRAKELVKQTQRFLKGKVKLQVQEQNSKHSTYSLMPFQKLVRLYWMLKKRLDNRHR
jgi:folate-dependent phosphoribosylglycinamide formyltransferase PurN